MAEDPKTKSNKVSMSDDLSISMFTGPYEGDGVFFACVPGGNVYIEGPPAALRRLANRINEKFPCA